MKTPVRCEPTPLERRRKLLEGVTGFSELPPALLEELAANMREQSFPLGAIIAADGEVGHRLFLIVEGHAEVSVPDTTEAVSLRVLGPGEMFGEINLLTPHRRQAMVAAMTPVHTLSLSTEVLEHELVKYPEERAELLNVVAMLLRDKFLRQHVVTHE